MEMSDTDNYAGAKAKRLEDKITLWTSLGHKERNRGVRWFASRSVAEQASIIMGVESLFPKLRQNHPETSDDELLRVVVHV